MFLWIWNADNIAAPENMVNILRELGVSDVCIKFHEGRTPGKFHDLFYQYAPVLKAAGIRVGAWGYNYFNGLDEEISFINEALQNADYYIFDAEGEVEGKYDQAEYVLSRVRQANPNSLIGYSPFPYADYHDSYPYERFDKYCNFASPQIYWQTIGNSVDTCIARMNQSFAAKGLRLPIMPSIQGYQQPIGDYQRFAGYGYSNFGIWSMEELDENCKTWLQGTGAVENLAAVSAAPQTGTDNTSIVKELQTLLNEEGITDENGNKLVVDGIIGGHTRSALSKTAFSIGQRNPLIGWAQRQLMRLGYSLPSGADSIFGRETYAAVGQFQQNRGLFTDHIIGVNTFTELTK